MMRAFIFIIGLLLCLQAQAQELIINELMSLNVSSITDEDGDYVDWIELYNPGDLPIDLGGWYLSDDIDETLKWQINEAEIEAQGYLLIFASSKDRQGPGPLHADFKISSNGEPIILSNQEGIVVDFLPAVSLLPDVSFGNMVDGATDVQVYFHPSSPYESNSEGVVYNIGSDVISFSIPGGFYQKGFALELSSEAGAEIRYTLDGSMPDISSSVYDIGIEVQDMQGQEDLLSLINTGFEWESPKTDGEKATVIKAASFSGGIRISPVFTSSYFVSERIDQRYEGIPVISLSVDADSLFSDSRGIYVPGDTYIESQARTTGNYQLKGREWEREVHMEFFDESHQKQFSQQVGARIHGKSSRKLPNKTLRLYARSEYGQSNFDYAFFKDKEIDEFKRILIRSPSTDYGATMFRDVLCTDLITEMEMDYMAWQICIVFINGEYWGIHNIRERIDGNYLAQNHPVSADNVNLLSLSGEVEEGSAVDFEELITYVQDHDLSQNGPYEHVLQKLDIENFIDYHIAEIYFANFDWPFVNIRYWKSQSEETKWRWIFHDCDRCMLDHDFDHLDNFIQQTSLLETEPEWATILFNRLLNNEEFRNEFVQRFIFHLSTTFQADKVLAKITELEAVYTPLVGEHNNRWNYPGSVNFWRESVEEMRAFVIRRPAIMVQQLLNYFGDQYTLYPNPVANSAGSVNLDMEYPEGVDTRVQIFTTMGEMVYDNDLLFNDGETHPKIPIDKLSSGLYIVRIQYGILVFFEKLMVQ